MAVCFRKLGKLAEARKYGYQSLSLMRAVHKAESSPKLLSAILENQLLTVKALGLEKERDELNKEILALS